MFIWCRKSDGDSSEQNLSNDMDAENVEIGTASSDASDNHHNKAPMFQTGVLRTNCIDCLDRTNVAQYAYGLVALGHQLHALGFVESPSINLDNPLAEDLMRAYETMGDTLALQYGGSAAHNKVIIFRLLLLGDLFISRNFRRVVSQVFLVTHLLAACTTVCAVGNCTNLNSASSKLEFKYMQKAEV